MFCVKCGQTLEEGTAFCVNCGAPAPAGQAAAGAETAGAASPALDATAVRTVADGSAPPPPVFTPVVSPLPPPQGGPVGYGPGAGGGWQPPQGQQLGMPYGPPTGPPPGGRRTGMIVGSIAAAVIVLAGLGIGLWLGLRHDDGKTGTTKVVSSTTTRSTTGGTTGSGGTTTSSGGASTTQTIFVLTTSAGPASTTTTADLLAAWTAAEEDLVSEMQTEDNRIPELATQINASAPDVPNSVYQELSDMADALQGLSDTMAATPVPSGFADAQNWLMQAATHMANRIQATMDGISVMWSTGSINSATADFNTGRTERDAYRIAIEQFYAYMPGD
jgi:hypothetical protein